MYCEGSFPYCKLMQLTRLTIGAERAKSGASNFRPAQTQTVTLLASFRFESDGSTTFRRIYVEYGRNCVKRHNHWGAPNKTRFSLCAFLTPCYLWYRKCIAIKLCNEVHVWKLQKMVWQRKTAQNCCFTVSVLINHSCMSCYLAQNIKCLWHAQVEFKLQTFL